MDTFGQNVQPRGPEHLGHLRPSCLSPSLARDHRCCCSLSGSSGRDAAATPRGDALLAVGAAATCQAQEVAPARARQLLHGPALHAEEPGGGEAARRVHQPNDHGDQGRRHSHGAHARAGALDQRQLRVRGLEAHPDVPRAQAGGQGGGNDARAGEGLPGLLRGDRHADGGLLHRAQPHVGRPVQAHGQLMRLTSEWVLHVRYGPRFLGVWIPFGEVRAHAGGSVAGAAVCGDEQASADEWSADDHLRPCAAVGLRYD
ncbi:hypothetical protein ON010_g5521 [Phytophthora cinnamomi]|nr:hypothetical protein ON010_g5521 [Phytophthora cinnamomi]